MFIIESYHRQAVFYKWVCHFLLIVQIKSAQKIIDTDKRAVKKQKSYARKL